MENASKALLIAAGVLIIILVISISMVIIGNTKDVSDDADKVGQTLAGTSSTASKKAVYVLEDLNGKSLIKVEQHVADTTENKYYSSYFPQNPKILLEPNTKYELSFDYKVNNATSNLFCSVGCGETDYILDIRNQLSDIYYKVGSNKKEGSCKLKFTTPDKFMKNIRDENRNIIGQEEIKEPYLHIRFARMSAPGSCSVEISNVRFKKV